MEQIKLSRETENIDGFSITPIAHYKGLDFPMVYTVIKVKIPYFLEEFISDIDGVIGNIMDNLSEQYKYTPDYEISDSARRCLYSYEQAKHKVLMDICEIFSWDYIRIVNSKCDILYEKLPYNAELMEDYS